MLEEKKKNFESKNMNKQLKNGLFKNDMLNQKLEMQKHKLDIQNEKKKNYLEKQIHA